MAQGWSTLGIVTERGGTLQTELPDEVFHGELMMGSDRFEHAADQGSGLQRFVRRHCDVVGAVDLGGQADMRALLPRPFVAECAQGPRQINSVNITRDFHTASTSSRTKWRRIT